jgi:hypothetical protein
VQVVFPMYDSMYMCVCLCSSLSISLALLLLDLAMASQAESDFIQTFQFTHTHTHTHTQVRMRNSCCRPSVDHLFTSCEAVLCRYKQSTNRVVAKRAPFCRSAADCKVQAISDSGCGRAHKIPLLPFCYHSLHSPPQSSAVFLILFVTCSLYLARFSRLVIVIL